MHQFRPDSDLSPFEAGGDVALGGTNRPSSSAAIDGDERRRFVELDILLDRDAQLARSTVPAELVDRVFASSSRLLADGASGEAATGGRPGLRLVGERRRTGRVAGRIGSALAMAASIAIAFAIGIPATRMALLATSTGVTGFGDAPFAATLGQATGAEPYLVSLLQEGDGGSWPGFRAVPISNEGSTAELLSIIETSDLHVDELADDVARMQRATNDRS